VPHDRIRMDRYDGGDVHDSERPLAALQNTLMLTHQKYKVTTAANAAAVGPLDK